MRKSTGHVWWVFPQSHCCGPQTAALVSILVFALRESFFSHQENSKRTKKCFMIQYFQSPRMQKNLLCFQCFQKKREWDSSLWFYVRLATGTIMNLYRWLLFNSRVPLCICAPKLDQSPSVFNSTVVPDVSCQEGTYNSGFLFPLWHFLFHTVFEDDNILGPGS